uniref:C-type lectin domain-containing protein n=1 Tax=Athene cunicularia TaxID=194338 RepID=A0A663MN00_ATHCN
MSIKSLKLYHCHEWFRIYLKSCPCSPVGTCSQGWVAFQSSCYRMGKESKPWKVAQQNCKTSSQGTHLLDIGSEEELRFILSYLQTISQIIMLWTGLNDLKVSLFYLLCYYICGSRRILHRAQFFEIENKVNFICKSRR